MPAEFDVYGVRVLKIHVAKVPRLNKTRLKSIVWEYAIINLIIRHQLFPVNADPNSLIEFTIA
jgi:hypothetical protein